MACQFNLPNPSPTRPASSPVARSQPSPSVTNTPSPLPVPPAEGLEAYYPFEGNANSQDNLHNGRRTKDLRFDTGVKGQSAFYMFGTAINDVAIYLEDGAAVPLGRTFSISVWSNTFPLKTNADSLPILCGYQSNHLGMGLFWTSGGADVFLNKDQPDELWIHQENSFRAELQDHQWHHTVVTYDSTQLKLYIDGKPELNKTFTRSSKDYGVINSIGKCSGILLSPDLIKRHDIFQGNIDELRIYSRVLTDAEVQALYQFDKGGNP